MPEEGQRGQIALVVDAAPVYDKPPGASVAWM